MQKQMMLVLAVLAVVGGAVVALDAWTLSGTLTNSTVDDGTTVFVRLIDGGGRCLDPRPPRYSATATLTDGKARYTVEGIAEGEYTVCAFFDLATGEGQGKPDSGDLGSVQTVTIKRDTTLDFDQDAWMPLP